MVPSCGGAAPTPATEAPVTPGVTTAETTPETSVTYRPEAGSVYQCQVPGINSDQNNCNKFWLCKENPEGSGILQVSFNNVYQSSKFQRIILGYIQL